MQKKEQIINGIKISYIEKKTDEISPLFVFLHGWGSSADAFSALFPHTKNALAINFPPFGGSSALPKPFILDDFVHLTHIFLEKHRSKNQKIVFVVHSFGGRVLLSLLQNTEILEKTEKIIAIGVPFFRFRTTKHKNIEKMAKFFSAKPLCFLRPTLQKVWYFFNKNSDYQALGENETMKKTFQNIISEDLEKFFPALSHLSPQKVFLMWGKNDSAAPFENVIRMQKIFPHINTFVFEHSGHFPFVDEKEKFVKIFDEIVLDTKTEKDVKDK